MMQNPVTKAIIYASFPFFWYFTKNPSQGAQTSIYCSISPEVVPGVAFIFCWFSFFLLILIRAIREILF
jgi:hypothetical protein